MRTGIVVPYYNHSRALPATVAALKRFGLPCWIVDDGSDAAERDIAAALVEREPEWLRLASHACNRGKGAAVLTGCRAAQAAGCTHALQIDADGQHDSADIPRLLAASTAHPYALILGVPRYDGSIPKSRLYGRYLTHIWVWINTLSFQIRDSMCGFRVYPLSIVLAVADEEKPGLRMEFDVEIAVRLHWRGVAAVGVPTQVRYPSDGVSHFNMWRDNILISGMHGRLFLGMLARLPGILSRQSRERSPA